MSTSVQFNGKEVQNRFLRGVMLAAGLVFMALGLVMAVMLPIFTFVVLVLLSPVLIALHYSLRLFGRRGLVVRDWRRTRIDVSSKAFARE